MRGEYNIMKTIEANYQITLSDFRKAMYYGLTLRYNKALKIMFFVLIICFFYVIIGLSGAWEINLLIPFIGIAYLIWGLLLFAGAERRIKNYIKDPNCFIGKEYKTTLDAKRVHIQIAECKSNTSYSISKLACVFEISEMFLIYITTQDLYILPKRALIDKDAESRVLRENFKSQLGDRFYTRYTGK